MIELDVNGKPHRIDPRSIEELARAITGPVPSGHGVCRVLVNGREMAESQPAQCDLATVRHVRVESAPFHEIASGAVAETSEWITRICGVLDSIANDYRFGNESQATGRLPNVADALQVLVHLLDGLRAHLPVASGRRTDFTDQWQAAQLELRDAIDDLARDLEAGDPVQLADRTGYTLPRKLSRFRELLAEIDA